MAKTILITGASSGFEQVWRVNLSAKGYNLALCARRVERLETLKQELQSQFSIQVGIRLALDVTHYDDVFTVLKPFSKNLGRLTVLLSMLVWVMAASIGKGNFEGTGATAGNQFYFGIGAV